MKLKDSAIIKTIKSNEDISEGRLKLMIDVVNVKYPGVNTDKFIIQKIKQYFNVEITQEKLASFFIIREEVRNKKSEVKHINY